MDDRAAGRADAAESAFPVVGVGASAGGLEAFTQLLGALPADTGMGFVLVQHLDPHHESALTQILGRSTSLPVMEITHGQRVERNHVHVIPRDTTLTIEGGVLQLSPREKSRTPHRPIDSFFESLAADQGDRGIGVVLSGTANDGTLGLEAIKAEGGITFAQDETAKHDSMPRNAIATGSVDMVLPPDAIALELARIAKHPYVAERVGALDRTRATADEDDDSPLPSGGSPEVQADPPIPPFEEPEPSEDGYRRVLHLLRSHSGVDFSLYRSTTIQRRVARRVMLTRHATLAAYANFLADNRKELDALYSDVLVSVTSFFRNPETFESVERHVLPRLLAKRGHEPVRFWVLGCSTGQEAYSLAMSFVEVAGERSAGRQLQIFATDLNEALLDKARNGLYARTLADDVSPERRRRFFVEEEGGYRVTKALREMVVFARHNLIADPPFSRMDLISCRNLLIYLDPTLQQRAIPTFHYALRTGGFLLLGASESIGGFGDLFEQIDKKHKIYVRKPAATPGTHLPVPREHAPSVVGSTSTRSAPPKPSDALRGELGAQREADRIAVQRFAPPAVLINAVHQVVQFRGTLGAYLEPPSGKATFDVLKMARGGVLLPLRSALQEAHESDKVVRRDNVTVQPVGEGDATTVDLEVIPLKNLAERFFLVVFAPADRGDGRSARWAAVLPARSDEAAPHRVAELESELAEMRDFLRAVREQHDASTEALQASNEEVQSTNEELQSLNEELETSKEELESANEELSTVNEEMNHRNVDLTRLNDDLVNLQTATRLSVILLNRDLTIRRFSPPAQKQFELLATDIGRPISHIRTGLVRVHESGLGVAESPVDLEQVGAEVTSSVREQELEVRHRDGRWYAMRVRPYLTTDNRVDGVVVVWTDIDDLKRSAQVVVEARDQAESVLATLRGPLLVLDKDLRVSTANSAFYTTFDVEPKGTIGRFLYELGNHQWDIPRLRELLEDVLPHRSVVEGYVVEHDFEHIGPRTMVLNARRLGGSVRMRGQILLAIEDITARRRAEEMSALLTSIVSTSEDAILSVDLRGIVTSWNGGAERLFGYAADEVSGTSASLLFDPEERWRGVLDEVLRGVPTEHQESACKHRDGSLLEVSLSVSPLRDVAGTIFGASLIARDVTDRNRATRAAREAESRYRTFTDQVRDYAIFRTDTRGHALTWNQGVARVLGFSESEFVGADIAETIFTPEDVGLGVPQAELDTAAAEGTANNDRWMRRKDGERFFANGVTTAIRDESGVLLGFTKVMRDSTAQRVMESRIKDQAEQLAIEARSKDEFLAMLGHELRNPLAPIRSAVHVLRIQGRGSDDPIQQKARDIIERQIGNLTKLVNDLLEVSRVVSGRVPLVRRTVDLNQVVRDAIETALPPIEDRKHELVVALSSAPIFVHADATRMEEAIINLLSNAARYTPEGGRIEIRCDQDREKGVARVSVRDNGVGIEPELLRGDRLFELFTQADRSLARSAGGLGIGLSVARRLVTLHGGTLEAHSPPGAGGPGSEFVVRLPLGAVEDTSSEASTSPQGPAPSDGATGRRVLLVDDNVDHVEMLASLLQDIGFHVRSAHTGPDALQVAHAWGPDIVLLDIGLPGLDGYEVARRLRADPEPRLRVVRIIALTGYGRDSDIELAKAAGFDAHLTKPFGLEELETLMQVQPSA